MKINSKLLPKKEEKNIMTIELNGEYVIQNTNVSERPRNFIITASVGNKLTYNNGEIIIGSGISKVLVSYNMTGQSTVSADRQFTYLIKGNANNQYSNLTQESMYFSGTGRQESVSVAPMLINVNEGDKIGLQVHGIKGNKLMGSDQFKKCITVEVVE